MMRAAAHYSTALVAVCTSDVNRKLRGDAGATRETGEMLAGEQYRRSLHDGQCGRAAYFDASVGGFAESMRSQACKPQPTVPVAS